MQDLSLNDAKTKIAEMPQESNELEILRDFIESSKRGIIR